MKHEISNSGGMRTLLKVEPLTNPQHQGWYNLEFSTIYDSADRIREQTNLRMCLDPEAFQRLQQAINQV